MFDRSKRRISFTDAGKIFHKHALALNEIHKSMLVDLGEFRETPA